MVLEEYPQADEGSATDAVGPVVVVVSARRAERLRESVERLRDELRRNTPDASAGMRLLMTGRLDGNG